MTFKNSVASCLLQYTTLTGRASRSEFWYFQLFIAAVSLIIYIVTLLLPPRLEGFGPVFQALFLIAVALPCFSSFVRRMHDVGGSAMRGIIFCIPVLNLLAIYWATRPGDPGKTNMVRLRDRIRLPVPANLCLGGQEKGPWLLPRAFFCLCRPGDVFLFSLFFFRRAGFVHLPVRVRFAVRRGIPALTASASGVLR